MKSILAFEGSPRRIIWLIQQGCPEMAAARTAGMTQAEQTRRGNKCALHYGGIVIEQTSMPPAKVSAPIRVRTDALRRAAALRWLVPFPLFWDLAHAALSLFEQFLEFAIRRGARETFERSRVGEPFRGPDQSAPGGSRQGAAHADPAHTELVRVTHRSSARRADQQIHRFRRDRFHRRPRRDRVSRSRRIQTISAGLRISSSSPDHLVDVVHPNEETFRPARQHYAAVSDRLFRRPNSIHRQFDRVERRIASPAVILN